MLAEDALASPDPVVILGDFNSHDKVEELERAGLRWLTPKLGNTTQFKLLGIPMWMSYDHVVTKRMRLAVGQNVLGIVADNRAASDHRPIWAVLALDE